MHETLGSTPQCFNFLENQKKNEFNPLMDYIYFYTDAVVKFNFYYVFVIWCKRSMQAEVPRAHDEKSRCGPEFKHSASGFR
jgi:hypothetical protein